MEEKIWWRKMEIFIKHKFKWELKGLTNKIR